jgi:thymidylate synthase
MTPSFSPLYYGDRVEVVNPAGDVGIITLWSPVRAAKRRLSSVVPGILDPGTSRVAVISNLYGDGMFAMFCNLLYNPQIKHLVAVGEDLGLPTCHEVTAFLEHGLEDVVVSGQAMKRIRGADRYFPAVDAFDESRLRGNTTFRYFGKLPDQQALEAVGKYLDGLPEATGEQPERVRVELPEFVPGDYSYRPSQVEAHQVVRRRPLDCWEELLVRCLRFGRPVTLGNGPRLELLNPKVVITDPAPEAPETLAQYGFRLDRFLAYQKRILDPELPDGIAYTYGHRLRGYFDQGERGRDTLATAIDVLRADPESRGAYVSLWDTNSDLAVGDDRGHRSLPCLTTLFFRRNDGRLSLTATYRAHNMLTAWLENVYGLMAIQRHVADALDVPVGSLTVLSHSLGVDPRSPLYSLARNLDSGWKRDEDFDREKGRHTLREDPNGYFAVNVDERERCLVAEHWSGGLLIKRYRSDRAAVIERAIIGDMAVSLVSHALWLGRELATKEQLLRELIGSGG